MNAIIDAVQAVLSVLIMISIGYILAHIGWIDKSNSKLLSKLIVNISLPALMISNITTTFTKEEILNAGRGIIIPFLVVGLSYIISIVISRIIKIDKERRGIFRTMFALSNTIFIGLPVNLALFGEESVMYVLFYYIANTVFFWTIGLYNIRRDGSGNDESIFTLQTLKYIFSPALMGLIVAILLVLFNISLPKFIMDSSKYIGNMTTPISMIFIGIVIHGIGLKKLSLEKGMGILFIGRFIITPLLVFVFAYLFPIPELMKKVFVIQSSLPVMTQTAIVAETYNADYQYASVMVVISTIASFVTIPIYMFIMA